MDGELCALLTPSRELLDGVWDELAGPVSMELLDETLDSFVDELEIFSRELEFGMIVSEELEASSTEEGESSPQDVSKVDEMIAAAIIICFIVILFFRKIRKSRDDRKKRLSFYL